MSSRRKTILIIEDAFDIQAILAELLGAEGYNIECAYNGREALEKLTSSSTLPDLILLDLMMPVMDGYEFRKAQKKNPKISSIPIIVMTADGQVESRSKTIGADAYLKKPFLDLDNIFETISRFFAATGS